MPVQALNPKVIINPLKVAVAGVGYVGLVTGVCMAHTGHNVTCVDIVVLRQAYAGFTGVPILVTNRRSAEMIKYASNDFMALKISYINEIANLCEIVGANIDDIAKGMGFDDRIGDKFLNAGIGYGGSCFPKDTKALHWFSNFYDFEIKAIKAIEVNEQQKLKLIKKVRKYYESLEGLTVAVLGLTFKPGTDDLREAPSLVNVPMLIEDGAIYESIGRAVIKSKDIVSYG